MNTIHDYARKKSAPGTKVANATVTVYYPTGTLALAPIYSDNLGTPMANPFTADASGLWSFYAADGNYAVRITGGTPAVDAPYTITYTVGSGELLTLPTDGSDVSGLINTALQNAHASTATTKRVVLPAGTYNLGTTTILVPGDVNFVGQGAGTELVSASTTAGIEFRGANFTVNGQFIIRTTALTAHGVVMTESPVYASFMNINCIGPGTALVGLVAAFEMDNRTSTATVNGGWLTFTGCYCVGYKYGWQFQAAPGVQTWTEITWIECTAVGRFGTPVSGSFGIYTDSDSVMAGSSFLSGSIEYFDYPMYLSPGVIARGISFYGGVEGNTNGNFYDPQYVDLESVPSYGGGPAVEIRSQGIMGSDPWLYTQRMGGTSTITEQYYAPLQVVYTAGSIQQEYAFYRGASKIGGNNPEKVFAFSVNPSNTAAPYTNYVEVAGKRMMWGAAPPGSGTFARGSVTWNTSAASGQPPFWVCTVAGSPGTWVAAANL